MCKIEIARSNTRARPAQNGGVVSGECCCHHARQIAVKAHIENLLPRVPYQKVRPVNANSRHPRAFDELAEPDSGRQGVARIAPIGAFNRNDATNKSVNYRSTTKS